MGREDLTDEQWAVLEPLLPLGVKAGRPPTWPRRRLIDGIRFRVRTGVPWRDVPVEYGPWSRVYDLFHRWQRNGTWHQVQLNQGRRTDVRGVVEVQVLMACSTNWPQARNPRRRYTGSPSADACRTAMWWSRSRAA